VVFELEPRGNEVLLALTHRKLKPGQMGDVAPGWHSHLDILEDEARGETRRPFWTNWKETSRQYMERMAPEGLMDTAEPFSMTLVRVLNASPEQAYAAWTDAAQMSKWFSDVYESDVRVGGKYSGEWHFGGAVYRFSGEYKVLEPGKRMLQTHVPVPEHPGAN